MCVRAPLCVFGALQLTHSHSHSDSLESLKSAKSFATLDSKHRRRPLGRQSPCLELKHLFLSVVCVP
ncbi:hypothetical protein AOLI_G00156490 [Acnodon oligacanthus]